MWKSLETLPAILSERLLSIATCVQEMDLDNQYAVLTTGEWANSMESTEV